MSVQQKIAVLERRVNKLTPPPRRTKPSTLRARIAALEAQIQQLSKPERKP
jgi:BMFP domain-containing protein YqiC